MTISEVIFTTFIVKSRIWEFPRKGEGRIDSRIEPTLGNSLRHSLKRPRYGTACVWSAMSPERGGLLVTRWLTESSAYQS